ncbi:DUF4825 domain-containing protein [Priestia megaterium]|nr:DUF4825 domain-containing protein [Priestia megaterium]
MEFTMKRLLIPMLSFSFLFGCQQSEEPKIVSAETNVKHLVSYKDSYVGDNSTIANIIAHLPGNAYFHQFSLQTKKKPYYISIDYKADKNLNQFEHEWSETRTKKTLLNNATALLILVQDANAVHFNVHTIVPQSITITRNELEDFYGRPLSTYAASENEWRKKVIQQIINNPNKVDEFYQLHPITELE